MSASVIVGVDVSKDKIDVCVLPKKERFTVEAEQYPAFAKKLLSMEPDLVVMEATGGYERPLHIILSRLGIPVAVVNPRPVRDYAKSQGFLAKTDALDAHVIAMFGDHTRPRPEALSEADWNSGSFYQDGGSWCPSATESATANNRRRVKKSSAP